MSMIPQLKLLLPVLVLSNACAGLSEQTNQTLYASLEFVSARLARALSYYPDDLCNREDCTGNLGEEPNTWAGFLGGGEGMSLLERRNAFDAYLSALGTVDLLACKTNSVDVSDRGVFKADEVELAISLCRVLNHTNAWTSLKSLALNPRGIAKDDALELAVKFGPVDGEMTEFVESVITNKTGWSKICRGSSACGGYATRLMELVPTSAVQRISKERAVGMFYRHRKDDIVGAMILDRLFVSCIEGYGESSNRLDMALFVLAQDDLSRRTGLYFTNVTNLLISSDQPLRQLTISEGGNE